MRDKNVNDYKYIGKELLLFQGAHNWKKYLFQEIHRFIGFQKLCIEIGSGIVTNARFISQFSEEYIGVEPDKEMVKIAMENFPTLNFINSNLKDFIPRMESGVNVVLLIDVLEHIKNDNQAIKVVMDSLKPNSFLVVLVPAHQLLFSKFDKSVGHYRRYSRSSISNLFSDFKVELKIRELDSIGFCLAFISKYLNPHSEMNYIKVAIWNLLIPISRLLDSILLYRFGKSLLLIAKKLN
jgi:SAM-dependent methyltransferase